MNEILRKLLNEATVGLEPDLSPQTTITRNELAKFAELIVRECAQVCRNQSNIYALKADRDNCAIAIEEHFGVQE